MAYEVYKNSVISEDSFVDLAGNTMYYPNKGERELGVDLDGDELADEDEILAVTLVCDRCGIPVDKKTDLTEQNGFLRCKNCLDME